MPSTKKTKLKPKPKPKGAAEKTERLKKPYLEFMSALQDIDREANKLKVEVRKFIEQEKIHKALEKIADIKDY